MHDENWTDSMTVSRALGGGGLPGGRHAALRPHPYMPPPLYPEGLWMKRYEQEDQGTFDGRLAQGRPSGMSR